MKKTIFSAILTITMLFLGIFFAYLNAYDSYEPEFFNVTMFIIFLSISLFPIVIMFYITFSMAINTATIRMNEKFISDLSGNSTFSKVPLFTKSFYWVIGLFTLLLTLSFGITITILELTGTRLFNITSFFYSVSVIYVSISFAIGISFLIATKIKLNSTQQEVDSIILDKFKEDYIEKPKSANIECDTDI